jgi:hypothetical protein
LKILSCTGMNAIVLSISSIVVIFLNYSVSAEDRAGYTLEDSVQYAFFSYIEKIVTELDADDADQLIDYLESLRDFPLDINTTHRSDLERFPFLSNREIDLIISTREKQKGFKGPEELYSISSIDPGIIHLLINFISFGTLEKERKRIAPRLTLRSHLSSEIQERRGYREGQYLGSPVTTHQRILIGLTPSMQGGLAIAKSAGERSLTERTSGYLSLGLFDNRLHLTVGDYRLHFGQGLTLWSGFGIAKSGNVVRNVFRRSTGVRPAASRSAHYLFRGGAVSFRLPSTETTLFYGNTQRAATVYDDGSVRTMITYPVYRTENDREKKNALTEIMFGAHIRQILSRDISIGLTWYTLQYNRIFNPDIATRFSGMKNHHGSIDWTITYRNIRFFGEIADNYPLTEIAMNSGVQLRLARGVETAITYRSYPSVYTSSYGFPFAERRGSADDERAVYLALAFRPAPHHLIEGYIDLYSFTNADRSPGLPVQGSDALFYLDYPLGSVSNIEARIRRRGRTVPVIDNIQGVHERILMDRFQNNIRIRLISRPHPLLRFRIHYEYVSVSYHHRGENESGSYIAADVRWNIRNHLQLDANYLIFNTDSFDSRLYTSEYDMPGKVRTVLLNGHGATLSVGLHYRFYKKNSISVKYSEIFRTDGLIIGSGLQQVDGAVLGIFMLQIDAGF